MSEAAEKKPAPTPWEQFCESPIVRLGERLIDLSDLKPLTLGDKKRLKADTGLSMAKLANDDPDDEATLVWFFLRLACPDLKKEEVDQLAAQDSQFVTRFVAKRAGEVDRPTSARSIASPAPTAGQAAS